jgi:hypothetical protein
MLTPPLNWPLVPTIVKQEVDTHFIRPAYVH